MAAASSSFQAGSGDIQKMRGWTGGPLLFLGNPPKKQGAGGGLANSALSAFV